MITGVETFGKNAVVCGRSKNVGLPIAIFLHGDGERGNDSGKYSSSVGISPQSNFWSHFAYGTFRNTAIARFPGSF